MPDLSAGKAWYASAFGAAPCFDEPFYVGFDIAGYELGLHPDMHGVTFGNNAVAYCGVPDIERAHAHLIDRGAQPRDPVKNVGGDIKVATVADPIGNVIGLIENPRFASNLRADRYYRRRRPAGPPLAPSGGGSEVMVWLQLLLVSVLAVASAGCELAGDIFEAGAWIGAIIVVLIIAVIGFVFAKIRG